MMTEPEQPMMYSTPTLDRRPRPPGSVPHRSISNAITNSPASGSSSTETPLSRQLYTRKLHSSPAMEETRGKEVMGLGLSTSTPSQTSSTITRDKTGHDIAQPSPSPPYGPIPTALLGPLSTPPTQDIDDPLESVDESRHEEDEEEERRARATDLAKSLGLTLLSPSKLSTDENEEDGLDAEEIRKQLIQMKRRLKVRDHELVMAAQAAEYLLRQHEELVSGLPPHVKDRLPLLHNITTPRQSVNRETGRVPDQPSSSSSPVLGRISDDHSAPNNSPSRSSGKRLFRTVRNNDSSKPFPHHHHKQARNIFSTPSRPTFAETIQQESDERLILLERALSESRENEEVQRKLAARLKRDFEKLQRDFEHAEQTMAEQVEERPKARSMDSTSSIESVTSSQFDSWAWKQTLNSDGEEDVKRVLRPKATRVKLRIKPKKVEREQLDMRDESDSAWGLTRFPSFPGEAGSSIGDRLTRLPPRPTFNRLKAKLRQPSPTKATSRHTQSASDDDLPVPSSRRETPSRSTRGRYPRAGMSNETSRSKSRSTSIHRVRDSPSRNAVTSSRQQTPLPGRYDSISSQLASVRKFVSESVRSVGFNGSRSLGSELGSEYGDHDHTSNEFEPVKKEQDGKDMWEDENTTASDSTDGVFSRPISIPAKASSGLSSLAMALSCSPVSKVKTPRRSPTRSPVDDLDPGSYRPKKGRRNWIRPLLLSQRYDTRPAMYPRSSSDGTVALAHRRQRSGKEELYDLVREISSRDGAERRERRLELYSPPARLVNDLIILLSILLEWIEMFVVIVYRVSVAVKYGRESIFRTWRQGRSKRYYL